MPPPGKDKPQGGRGRGSEHTDHSVGQFRPCQMEVVNDQDNRLRQLLQSRQQQVIGSSAVRGKALVKRHQDIIAGQGNLSGSSLNRPDHTVKEPCRLGIETVQRQPGALEIAFPDPIAQEGRFAVAGRGCDQRQPVSISCRRQSVFKTRAL